MLSRSVHLQDRVRAEEVAMALAVQKGVMGVLRITIAFINPLLETLWRSILRERRRKYQAKAALEVRKVMPAHRILKR